MRDVCPLSLAGILCSSSPECQGLFRKSSLLNSIKELQQKEVCDQIELRNAGSFFISNVLTLAKIGYFCPQSDSDFTP